LSDVPLLSLGVLLLLPGLEVSKELTQVLLTTFFRPFATCEEDLYEEQFNFYSLPPRDSSLSVSKDTSIMKELEELSEAEQPPPL